MWAVILWACVSATDTASEGVERCSRPCLDSPYHRCGEYQATTERVACVELAGGIDVGVWTAHRITVEGVEVHGLRVGPVLSVECTGEAVVDLWTVSTVEGCGLVERIPVSCAALRGGFHADPDVERYTVEAEGVEGLQGIQSATEGLRLYADCPEGVEWAVVTSTLSTLDEVGAPMW